MSKVNISIVKVTNITGTRESALVEDAASSGDTETITSSASNQVTTIAATAVDSDNPYASPASPYNAPGTQANAMIWRVANMGADDIYVAFGSTPLATATSPTSATTARKGVPAGIVAYFGVSQFGDKAAVVNA